MLTAISYTSGFIYKHLLKPLYFQLDPELVHIEMVKFGELLGTLPVVPQVLTYLFDYQHPTLAQTLHAVKFYTPVGLAAGFDYEARLTQILPSIGFGFGTVGTITNMSYGGNPRPMLGRLPKSRSLLVNKGFKNDGAEMVARKLKKLNFPYPVGISIGRTNSLQLKTQKQSITDICKAFEIFERAKVGNAYYELNISCPNLFGEITFYPPKNLKQLLAEVKKLKIKKPVLIKMPIEKSNPEFLRMLEIIVKFPIAGVIIGNLQKNRQDPALYQNEVAKFPKGNFSGKPCWARSNELIKLAYKHYRKKLTLIGCGGVFSAADAYTKIKLGASLVQLITGMIYEGPQMIGQINRGLVKLLKQDGCSHISEAVGVEN